MLVPRKEVFATLSFGRTAALVFLGVILGLGMAVGTYYGVKEYAPDLAARYFARMLNLQPAPDSPDGTGSMIDSNMVKSVVQEVLGSDQGRAIISDFMRNQSKETFEAFFTEAMKSPEFRQALSNALGTFLESAEGKALLRRIASEVMTP